MEDIQIISDSFLNSPLNNPDLKKTGQVVFCKRPLIVYFDTSNQFSQKITQHLSKSLNANVLHFENYKDLVEATVGSKGELATEIQVESQGPFCFLFHSHAQYHEEGLLYIETLKQKKYHFFSMSIASYAQIPELVEVSSKNSLSYLTIPFELPQLTESIVKGFAQKVQVLIADLSKQNEWDTNQISVQFKQEETSQISEESLAGIVGRSSVMRLLFDRINRSASNDTPVFLCGEKGTGKHLIAQVIHKLSGRGQNSLNQLNCRLVPAQILEQELFGSFRISSNSQHIQSVGKIESSQKSTLLLAEIDYLTKNLQERLIKFVQSKQVDGQMGAKPTRVDLKLIFSGEKNLEKLVLEGKFREDFLYSLGHTLIKVPALRERKEDISLLIGHFVKKYTSTNKSNFITFSGPCMDILMRYDWPGNVKELEDLVMYLVIHRGGTVINPEDLPINIHSPKVVQINNLKEQVYLPETGINLKSMISDLEDALIIQAMGRTNGNKHKAAQLLGLNRTTLIEKMKKKKLS
ncbi:MAG: sigma 54-interacting transcriptional regulator [Bacteriovoracaceae bacterium]|nr:sigma 54-interacting transcriptional regulator [Bacteriovoracaceae bacterium]